MLFVSLKSGIPESRISNKEHVIPPGALAELSNNLTLPALLDFLPLLFEFEPLLFEFEPLLFEFEPLLFEFLR